MAVLHDQQLRTLHRRTDAAAVRERDHRVGGGDEQRLHAAVE
jgi:hypothetical protein